MATFYDDHHAKNFSEVDIDSDVLLAVQAHRDSGLPDPQWILDAVNPSNNARGIRDSTRKTFVQYRTSKNIAIVQ